MTDLVVVISKSIAKVCEHHLAKEGKDEVDDKEDKGNSAPSSPKQAQQNQL